MPSANDERGACIVQRADADQSDLVLALLRQIYGAAVEQLLGKSVREVLAAPGEFAFIAFFDRQPIGCILISLGSHAILHSLGVLEIFRGKGFANDLIATSISWANENSEPPEAFVTAVDTRTLGDKERFTRFGFSKAPFESPPDSPPDLELLELKNQRTKQAAGNLIGTPT